VNPGGPFPYVIVDVVLSSDDDEVAHPPEPDALVDRKVSAGDDVRDVGITSAEALVPGQIGTSAPGNPSPLSPIRSPLYHLQAVMAENGYTLQRSGPIWY
jgi:hypothetical protein